MNFWIYSAVVVVLLASVAGVAAPQWPYLDYCNHFRPQLLLAGLILASVAALSRRRLVMALALVAVLVNAVMMSNAILASRPPATAPAPAYAPLKIIAANVLVSNKNTAALTTLIEEQDPDIVVLLELTPLWAKAMAALQARYPHQHAVIRDDSFGVGVYAKYPFTPQVTAHGTYGLPLLRADFPAFTLLAAHPISPMTATNRADLRTYLQDIAAFAATQTRPVVLAGDLNATLWSDTMRPLWHSGFFQIGHPFNYTWPSLVPPLAIQIDHVLATGNVRGDLRVLPTIGSDHFPILASLQIPALAR